MMTDLTLYATISVCLMGALLLVLIICMMLDRGDRRPDDGLLLEMLVSQRSRQPATWPTPRGEDILIDTQIPGRHKPLNRFMAESRRPSLVTASLNQAIAWLAVDRVRREAERDAFHQLQNTTRWLHAGRPLLGGSR